MKLFMYLQTYTIDTYFIYLHIVKVLKFMDVVAPRMFWVNSVSIQKNFSSYSQLLFLLLYNFKYIHICSSLITLIISWCTYRQQSYGARRWRYMYILIWIYLIFKQYVMNGLFNVNLQTHIFWTSAQCGERGEDDDGDEETKLKIKWMTSMACVLLFL